MGEHAEVTLALPGLLRFSPQGGPQQPLVSGEGTLRLPALPVDPPVATAARLLAEAPDHLPPVARLGPLAPPLAAVERDDGGAHAQVLPGEAVVLFAVEGRVAQHAVPADDQGRLLQHGPELRGVVTGADGDGGSGEEMAAGVAGDGELDEGVGALRGAGADIEVAGGVPALQAGGVDGRLGLGPDQAALLGARGGLEEEQDELPFFNSRCSALHRVE